MYTTAILYWRVVKRTLFKGAYSLLSIHIWTCCIYGIIDSLLSALCCLAHMCFIWEYKHMRLTTRQYSIHTHCLSTTLHVHYCNTYTHTICLHIHVHYCNTYTYTLSVYNSTYIYMYTTGIHTHTHCLSTTLRTYTCTLLQYIPRGFHSWLPLNKWISCYTM